MLYYDRKQDSLIFVGSGTHTELLDNLQSTVQDMFRSDCPIFLPIEYSRTVEMKLDNNFVFYENHTNGTSSLIDKFTVNGGPEIVMEIGTWDSNGVELKKTINRWDRRTDLMGATFVNTLYENNVGSSAFFIYDSNGTIIGSKGHYQDQLFYILDRLNVTIETRDESKAGEGLSKCPMLLGTDSTDICSGGYRGKRCVGCVTRHIVTMKPAARTLLAGVPKENAPDAWVYIDVFGWLQWLLLFLLLTIISLMMPLFGILLGRNLYSSSLSEGFATTYLFLLQQGDHPENRLMAKRILSITTSMLTLLFFIYYANDITAKMTAGSPPHPVQNFQDVLDRGYEVIVVGSLEISLLKNSKEGSAKHSVFKLYYEEDWETILDFVRASQSNNTEEANRIVLPFWYKFTKDIFDWAAKQIMDDRKTLWYSSKDFAAEEIEQGNVIELQMDDMTYVYGGFLLRKNSEYVSVINHYVQKAFETGIFNRMHRTYSSRVPIKIGMTEPGPLGINNVMGIFSVLGLCIIISLLIAFAEKLVQKKNKATDKLVDPVGVESPSEPHTSTRSSGKMFAKLIRRNKNKGEVDKEHTIPSFPQTVKNANSEVDLTVIA